MTEGPMVTDDLEATDPYAFHMRNEHRDRVPGTSVAIDEETGWRYEYRYVGMTRNAKRENQKPLKVYLDPIPHAVLDQNIPMRGWYKNKVEAKPTIRPRPCYSEAILTQPYGGFCHVGCGFCYINNGTRGYRGQGITTVDPRYGEKIARQLRGMRKGTAVYMSSFIDPFLEIEEHYGNTRNCSTAVTEAGLPIFFLTRMIAPDWAYDHLKLNPHSYMQFSINTPNPDDWRRLSPRAATLPTMFDQVREMKAQGIYVSIQVNPIVAGVVSNDDVVELIHLLAEAGADHLIFKFVEIVYPSAPGLLRNMRARFPDRADAFERLFTQSIGGVRTIDEDYRKAALDRFARETAKAGVTMSLCYEYEYERDDDGNVVSKTGVSLGGKYLTADQCHGHRVPMYTRASADELFQPVDECPPSGCLTCGDEGPVPCGNEELGKAKAMEPKDYRTPVYQIETK